MRTLELLKHLSAKEVMLIEEKVKSGRRKSLLPLFIELKKHLKRESEPGRALLFEKTYNKPYSKGKDYLLRNELRLLNEIVYEFLVMDSFKKSAASNPSLFNRWLAQSYYDRKIPVFGEDINGFIAEARQRVQLGESTVMCSLRTYWVRYHLLDEKGKLVELVKEWQQEETRRFLHRYRQTESALAYFNRYFNQAKHPGTDDWSEPGIRYIDLAQLEQGDWYARYHTLQKGYHQSKGEAQLKYLEEIISICNSRKAKGVISEDSKITSIESMAFTLYNMGRHAQADSYMEEPIKLRKKNRIAVPPSHIAVYMANQMLLGRYKHAIALFYEYKDLLLGSSNREYAIVVLAYCYLFLHKPDEALNIISGKPQPLINEVVHSRYIYIISFLLRKQYSLASAEIINLKRVLKKEAVEGLENDWAVTAFFQSYLKILMTGGSFKNLKIEVAKTLSISPQVSIFNPQLYWLRKQMETEK